MAFALLEPTLPLWLLETMNASHWQIGTPLQQILLAKEYAVIN